MNMNKSNLKELVKTIMREESEYQQFFKKALEKAGKGINDMSDDEKKAFFNKIDAAWDGKGEKNEALVGNQHKLDVDGDGDIEGDDLADLRAGKKADEATELPSATIPSAIKSKLDLAIDKIKDSNLTYNQKIQVVGKVMDSLGIDKAEFNKMASKLKGTMESVNEKSDDPFLDYTSSKKNYVRPTRVGRVVKYGNYKFEFDKNEWNVTLFYNGKQIAYGYPDWSDGAFLMNHHSWGTREKKFKSLEDIIKYFKSNKITTDGLKESVNEESFTAINKTTGKTSVFKSKDTRDAAIKAGTHDKIKDSGDSKKSTKGGVNIFNQPAKSDDGFGWGPETDRTVATSLPKKASQLEFKHTKVVEDVIKAATGLSGTADTNDDTGAIMFTASSGDSPTYTIFLGSNEDYGKPDEFRVSLESTYGNDPSGLEGKVDKTFKSAEEAMKFAAQVAKKYSKEMQMDDEDTNESVNEGVSSSDMDKIKGAVEAANSFMGVGSELKKLGMKYTFATEPLPIYIIQPTPNNKVAIVNKKYASKPDFVVGDIAVGIMESKSPKSVNEQYTWKEIDRKCALISNFAQVEKNIVKKFIQDNNLDMQKILNDVRTATPVGRMLFAKVVEAEPNSQIQKNYIRRFALKSGKLTEGRLFINAARKKD